MGRQLLRLISNRMLEIPLASLLGLNRSCKGPVQAILVWTAMELIIGRGDPRQPNAGRRDRRIF